MRLFREKTLTITFKANIIIFAHVYTMNRNVDLLL